VKAEEFAEFVLERFDAVMRFLIFDVSLHLLYVRRTNRKARVSALPGKRSDAQLVAFDQLGRLDLHGLNEPGDRRGPPESAKRVDVVGNTADN
jgi:hypothetical protein